MSLAVCCRAHAAPPTVHSAPARDDAHSRSLAALQVEAMHPAFGHDAHVKRAHAAATRAHSELLVARESVLRSLPDGFARQVALASLDEERAILCSGHYPFVTDEWAGRVLEQGLEVYGNRLPSEPPALVVFDLDLEFTPLPLADRLWRDLKDHGGPHGIGIVTNLPLYGPGILIAGALDLATFPLGTWWYAGVPKRRYPWAGPLPDCSAQEAVALVRAELRGVTLEQFLANARPRAAVMHLAHFQPFIAPLPCAGACVSTVRDAAPTGDWMNAAHAASGAEEPVAVRAVAPERDDRCALVVSAHALHRTCGNSFTLVEARGQPGATLFRSGERIDALAHFPDGTFVWADDDHRVVRFRDPSGRTTSIGGRDGLVDGTNARFSVIGGLATGPGRRLVIADTGNHAIRVIEGGAAKTLAGGHAGFVDGAAEIARFSAPRGVAVDPHGNVYVADTGNGRIRVIEPSGNVRTLPIGATLNQPVGVTVGRGGVLFIADTGNRRILAFQDGATCLVAGHPERLGALDGPASIATFDEPVGVVELADGSLIVADKGHGFARRVQIPVDVSVDGDRATKQCAR